MIKILNCIVVGFFCLIVTSCSGDKEKKDTSELWSKSQATQDIIERSGTQLDTSTAEDRQLALTDAENRLMTGGGLFGKKGGIELLSLGDSDTKGGYTSIGMPINPYLWRGSLETISFMPLQSADPFGGIIITEWYTDENNTRERCKLNIFIKGAALKSNNLKVSSFCQTLSGEGSWVDQKINSQNNAKLENAILNKAKKLKLSQS